MQLIKFARCPIKDQKRADFIRWIGIYPPAKLIHSSYNRALIELKYFNFYKIYLYRIYM